MTDTVTKTKPPKIVIAVQDELFGQAIVNFIEKHSWSKGTQFHVISVIEPNILKNPLLLPAEVIEDISNDENESAKLITNALTRKLYAAADGIRVRRYLKKGDAKHEIMKLCSELRPDYVILGSHRRGNLDRLLLGSVANAVATHVQCSTIIIRPTKQEWDEFNRLVFKFDDLPETIKDDLEFHLKEKVETPTR